MNLYIYESQLPFGSMSFSDSGKVGEKKTVTGWYVSIAFRLYVLFGLKSEEAAARYGRKVGVSIAFRLYVLFGQDGEFYAFRWNIAAVSIAFRLYVLFGLSSKYIKKALIMCAFSAQVEARSSFTHSPDSRQSKAYCSTI